MGGLILTLNGFGSQYSQVKWIFSTKPAQRKAVILLKLNSHAKMAPDTGTNAGLRLRDQAVETSQKVSSGMSDVIQRNPLLFGGLGLTVGMLIASALPKSDIEKDIMGGASADIQKRSGRHQTGAIIV